MSEKDPKSYEAFHDEVRKIALKVREQASAHQLAAVKEALPAICNMIRHAAERGDFHLHLDPYGQSFPLWSEDFRMALAKELRNMGFSSGLDDSAFTISWNL